MIADWTDLEPFRIVSGALASEEAKGRSGAFSFVPTKKEVNIIAIADAGDNDDTGWERVSITVQCMRRKGRKRQIADRPPIYGEIMLVKNVFWHDFETVIQVYGKNMGDPRMLTIELWRKKDGKMITPYDDTDTIIKIKPEENTDDGKERTSEAPPDSTDDKV